MRESCKSTYDVILFQVLCTFQTHNPRVDQLPKLYVPYSIRSNIVVFIYILKPIQNGLMNDFHGCSQFYYMMTMIVPIFNKVQYGYFIALNVSNLIQPIGGLIITGK